jgi:hypothetical protein
MRTSWSTAASVAALAFSAACATGCSASGRVVQDTAAAGADAAVAPSCGLAEVGFASATAIVPRRIGGPEPAPPAEGVSCASSVRLYVSPSELTAPSSRLVDWSRESIVVVVAPSTTPFTFGVLGASVVVAERAACPDAPGACEATHYAVPKATSLAGRVCRPAELCPSAR